MSNEQISEILERLSDLRIYIDAKFESLRDEIQSVSGRATSLEKGCMVRKELCDMRFKHDGDRISEVRQMFWWIITANVATMIAVFYKMAIG